MGDSDMAITEPAGFMDPRGVLPAGDPLLLTIQRSSAPLSPQPRVVVERALRFAAAKPLRPPKERHPVAATVDVAQVRSVTAPPLHSVPPAPPPRAPVAPPGPPSPPPPASGPSL